MSGDTTAQDTTTAEGTAQAADELFHVVRNHEEQYSIWRTDKPVPDGWETVGEPMAKDACLERIGELWTDMRPASLRRAMEGAAADTR
ncbi:MbtH family protein [Streptomyces daliensis]|uniref:MbtH family NRPS accessory protein n=1 Tax=Streptomyces daliensis TaxID=299421 RepID=A0A8T4IUJ8_9ACTN|nr:MbtH family NRPS accessory protein [Streptomyces daliensis]